MNFNVYVNDSLGESLRQLAADTGKKRNTIVREALESWIASNTKKNTPPKFLAEYHLKPQQDDTFEPLENHRKSMIAPRAIEL